MNIIVPDIDTLIVSHLKLSQLAIMMTVNRFFRDLVSKKPIMSQWKKIDSIKYGNSNNIFSYSCRAGFHEYAIYLVNNYEINIHYNREHPFQNSCINGNFEIAKWLIQLGEKWSR